MGLGPTCETAGQLPFQIVEATYRLEFMSASHEPEPHRTLRMKRMVAMQAATQYLDP